MNTELDPQHYAEALHGKVIELTNEVLMLRAMVLQLQAERRIVNLEDDA